MSFVNLKTLGFSSYRTNLSQMTTDFPFLFTFLKTNRCGLETLGVLQLKAENHSSGDLVHQKPRMWNSKEKYLHSRLTQHDSQTF